MEEAADIAEVLRRVRTQLEVSLPSSELAASIEPLDDDAVIALVSGATALIRHVERIRTIATGVVAARSARDAGHGGVAQARGHRNTVALVQSITGTSRSEAMKTVRVAEAIREAERAQATRPDPDAGDGKELAPGGEALSSPAPVPPLPWHAPLARAMMSGALTAAQHDAIRRGLGEPPAMPAVSSTGLAGPGADTDMWARTAAGAAREAWSLAAEQLAEEAAERTVEELAQLARTIRDRLDPEGPEARFDARFARRSFRAWTDQDGQARGSFVFDDEAAAWVRTIIDAALRPRRGGPRFVDPDERSRAEELAGDPRTNDQLAYDLVLDVLRAGALAEAEAVFGARQAGVRIVQVIDVDDDPSDERARNDRAWNGRDRNDLSRRADVVHTEDGLVALPGWLAEQKICDTGTRICGSDRRGNPLDLGREQRLYTSAQRVALAIRDGGCRWKGCDRPASYCEAHHIDPWTGGGRTDIDRGILLCRYHHMALHNGGWRITRIGRGEFFLHPPDGGEAVALLPRLALRYAWGDIDPPPMRFLLVA